jgi:RNA polymerase sigma factor (sigma-70 family)
VIIDTLKDSARPAVHEARVRADQWDLSGSEPLPPPELDAALRRYRDTADPRAANLIVRSHLRLVASIARRFRGSNVPMDDLMAEGAVALYRALRNFDPSQGTSFTSYASVIVGFAMKGEAREHGRVFRVPGRERVRSAARRLARAVFYAEHGRWPTPAETGPARSGSACAGTSMPEAWSAVSLDAERDTGTGRVVTVADAGLSPLEQAAGKDDAARVESAIAGLPPRVAKAVRLRFGIGSEPCSIQGMAHVLRMSPSAVEIILNEGLRSIRHSLSVPADHAETDTRRNRRSCVPG